MKHLEKVLWGAQNLNFVTVKEEGRIDEVTQQLKIFVYCQLTFFGVKHWKRISISANLVCDNYTTCSLAK